MSNGDIIPDSERKSFGMEGSSMGNMKNGPVLDAGAFANGD
jgi:hypothetical protein